MRDMAESNEAPPAWKEIADNIAAWWRSQPDKAVFGFLAISWILLFHFFGNSTLGYVPTRSLFLWLRANYENPEEAHGLLIPFVVAALYYVKRDTLIKLPKSSWWPAFGIVLFAAVLHVTGYIAQQTRISVAAFFLGLYGLSGVIWGKEWLRASLFPFFLFVFCVPLGKLAEPLSQELRSWATQLTYWVTHGVFGIQLVRQGNLLFEASGKFQYEVAAACSGIRSLTATLAIAIIFAFVALNSTWKRLLMILSAFPLAVFGNVLRLTCIIFAAEIFQQKGGNFVHDNAILSLLPYIPPIMGLLAIGRLLDRHPPIPGTAS
jgi:exosortase